MKNLFVIILMVLAVTSCEDHYENVKDPKHYTGDPFVSLNSERAVISLEVNKPVNNTWQAGVYKDKLVLSHPLDHDISVTLEVVNEETFGSLDTNFEFQQTVVIEAGDNYGSYTISALSIPEKEISKYKLAIRIKEVDDPLVIAGLYGIKKENEERKKRFKTYSFQK